MDRKVADVAELLIKTPGDPSNWPSLQTINSTTINSLGFASSDNVLEFDKLDGASSIDYPELKKILGLSKEDVFITVSDLASSNKSRIYEYGFARNDTSVVVTRYGLLNGTLVEVRTQLYYKI